MSSDASHAADRVREQKRRWHADQAKRPLREKVRILLELQKQELRLLERQRPLKPWERPWHIEP